MSWITDQLRRHDRERFVTALFAPAGRRPHLMVLYAFNLEVARVQGQVREPLAGAIRLQWWRDVVEGGRPADEIAGHPVAAPLGALVAAGTLPAPPLLRLLEAREHDLEQGREFADLDALAAYAADTSGGLAEAALALLDAADPVSLAAGRCVGTAYALAGLLRALPQHLSTGRLTLPRQTLAAAGTSAEAIRAGRAGRAEIARAARSVGEHARALLAEARRTRTGRAGLAALLPATQASAALRRLQRAGWDPFAADLSRPLSLPLRLTVKAVLGRF
jgi:phytoene synthase